MRRLWLGIFSVLAVGVLGVTPLAGAPIAVAQPPADGDSGDDDVDDVGIDAAGPTEDRARDRFDDEEVPLVPGAGDAPDPDDDAVDEIGRAHV
jgi:hypothetical protein